MKKVYQAGNCAPVRTYKAALRQHAKFKMVWYDSVWRQPIGCSTKYSVNQWGYKQLINNNGKQIGWSGLKAVRNFG